MTYEDFISRIKEAGISADPYHPFSLEKIFIYSGNRCQKKMANPIPYIIQYWDAGGVSGGSCWDSSDPQSYVGETAPRLFPDFDKILMLIVPNISFLQYQTIQNEVLKEGEETEYAYYGNSTTYGYRLVILEDLYNKLVEMEIIQS